MSIYSSYTSSLPSPDKILPTLYALTGSIIFLKTFSNELIPQSLQSYFSSTFHSLFSRLSSHLTIVIEDFQGLTPNRMFHASNVYLGTIISPSTHRIKVNKPPKDDDLTVLVDKDQEIVDYHNGIKFSWVLQSSFVKQTSGTGNSNKGGGNVKSELRYFELSFNKKHRDYVLKSYLPYVFARSKEIEEETKTVRLHTVDYQGPDYWSSVVLNHPARFETMAMDPGVKDELVEDLDRFVTRKEYYRRVGKAWKRGYLFYGPPGTGKSSLVAAMAKYLKFDVYDLDLKEVQCNSDLRRLLIGTANRSILVIEDIDCNVGLHNRETSDAVPEDDKITLSGLLNFIDGLWSSCGDERIIVFTTNHKNRLDPALLRPGRMDVQLEMSYCCFSGFKILASNYLRVEEHVLFPVIKQLLKKVQATPAEIAGELMKSEDASIALQSLVKFLEGKQET